MPSHERITRHEAALEWPATYLIPDHQGSVRMLGLWAATKINKRSFARVVKARGVARNMAYQLRDQGLSLISQGLDRDGVPVEFVGCVRVAFGDVRAARMRCSSHQQHGVI